MHGRFVRANCRQSNSFLFYVLFTGQAGDSSSQSTSPLGEAGSDGLVNLGLFADRRAAYRMLATEGACVF